MPQTPASPTSTVNMMMFADSASAAEFCFFVQFNASQPDSPEVAFDRFLEIFDAKYPNATALVVVRVIRL